MYTMDENTGGVKMPQHSEELLALIEATREYIRKVKALPNIIVCGFPSDTEIHLYDVRRFVPMSYCNMEKWVNGAFTTRLSFSFYGCVFYSIYTDEDIALGYK